MNSSNMPSFDGSFEDVEKSYFYQLWVEFKGNWSAMARKAGIGRAAIRQKFKKWGWSKEQKLIVPEEPGPPPPPLSTLLNPAPSTLNAQPPTHSPPSTDLLAPEVRAKMEVIKARRGKGKKGP